MCQRKKPTNELPNNNNKTDKEITTHKKRYISPKERQQNINELRLIPKKTDIFRNIHTSHKKINKLFINQGQ